MRCDIDIRAALFNNTVLSGMENFVVSKNLDKIALFSFSWLNLKNNQHNLDQMENCVGLIVLIHPKLMQICQTIPILCLNSD